MFQTIGIQNLENFEHREDLRFGFQNLEDWKLLEIQMQPRAHMSVAPAA
jgi:hypothetical protein